MASVPFIFATQFGPIPLSELDANFNALTGPGGSTLIGFTASGTGAVTRTMQDKNRDIVCVKDFGATGNGSTDDTASMQAAHNTGSLVYYPKGAYKFSTLTISAGGIIGDGEAYTYLGSTDTGSGNTITYSAVNLQPGTAAPVFRGFILTGQSSKTTGSGIFVTAPSSENQGAQFDDVTVYNFPFGVSFGSASNWNIQNCKFINYLHSGILVANTNNPDSGDSTIMGCLFNTSIGSSTSGINYQSSGGLKVIGNKFNGGSYGFFLGLNAPANTSDLLFMGNSIENQTVAAMQLARTSGSATFSNIVIVGNQMAINPFGVVSDGSGAFSGIVINDNVIQLTSGTGAGVNLSSGSNFLIEGNTISGNGGTPSGVDTAAACSNGKIGRQLFSGITTGGRINNSSATVVVETDTQIGNAVSVTTNAAYGSLFAGSTAIVFPTPYSLVPVVTCSASGVGGGVAASAVSVTTTGFSLQVVGVTNGGVVTGCQWIAQGVI